MNRKSLVYTGILALCLTAVDLAHAQTAGTPLANSVTEQDRTQPLGWRDAPKPSSDLSDNGPCSDAAYAKPEVHGVVSTGIATGSHMGTVTGEAGAVSLTKRLGDCGRPLGSIGVSLGASRINGGGVRTPGY